MEEEDDWGGGGGGGGVQTRATNLTFLTCLLISKKIHQLSK